MRRMFLVLGIALLAVLLLLGWLLMSESGSRWLLGRVAEAVPQLSVQETSGRLYDGMTLCQLVYRQDDGLAVSVERFEFAWMPSQLMDNTFQVDLLAAEGVDVSLPMASPAASQEASPIVVPEQIPVPLIIELKQLDLRNVTIRQGEQAWPVDQLTLAARLDSEGLTLHQLDIAHPEMGLSATGSVAARHPFAMNLQTDWHVKLPAGLQVQPKVNGKGSIAGSLERLQLDQRMDLAGGSRVHGSVSPDIEGNQPTFDLNAEWKDFQLPLEGDSLHIRNAGFAIRGGISDYRFSLNNELQLASQSEQLKLEANGTGNLENLVIERADLEALGGRTSVQGQVAWAPSVTANAQLQLSELNPGLLLSEWPGRLSGKLNIRADVANESYQVDLKALQGELRGYPLEGRGGVSMLGKQLQATDVALRTGDNRVELNGQLMPRLAVDFDLKAQALQQIMPQLAGQLEGKGRVTGDLQNDLENLAVSLNLKGSALEGFDTRVTELSAQAHINPSDPDKSQWQLQANDMQQADIQVKALRVQGTGNLTRHELQAMADSNQGKVSLALAGEFDGKRWLANLPTLELSVPDLGEWRLSSPAQLDVSQETFSLSRICLAQDQSILCAEAAKNKSGVTEAAAQINNLPLALAKPWLDSQTLLDGELNGTVSAQQKPGKPWQAQASLTTTPGKLAYLPDDGEPLETTHQDGQLGLSLDGEEGQAKFSLGLGQAGRLSADAELASEVRGQRALNGDVDFRLDDPGVLTALLPQLTEWQGAMKLRAKLGGSLQQPRVQLQGGWDQGQVRIADLGIVLKAVDLQLDGNQDALDFRASAESGDGKTQLGGRMQMADPSAWKADLKLTGDNFRVVQRTDLEMTLSPDLSVALQSKKVSVKGKVLVPYARVQPVGLPEGAADVSPDEIIVGEQAASDEAGEAKGAVARVLAQIKLILGKDVRLNAFGLATRLEGELDLNHKPDAPLEGFGQLSLAEGRYKAYGQDLRIEQGRLLFAGPLEAARADVRAFRKSGDVIAGIWLTGPIVDPKTTLYSEPQMEEAEILSYILTGSSLGDGGGGPGLNAVMLTDAAIGLGLDKSGLITEQVAEALGLDEFKLAAGEDGIQGSTLTVGKQLSPNLQVRYLYGLFDDLASVQLRYTLSRRLRLEGAAGKAQSADLIYEVESD